MQGQKHLTKSTNRLRLGARNACSIPKKLSLPRWKSRPISLILVALGLPFGLFPFSLFPPAAAAQKLPSQACAETDLVEAESVRPSDELARQAGDRTDQLDETEGEDEADGATEIPVFSRQDWQPLMDWVVAPEAKLAEWVTTLGPKILAYANPEPWPEIHSRAQEARVPVVMYHDILSEMQVFFDVTPEKLERDFQRIQENNLTPISLSQLVAHLRTGMPLPEKPIVLTFDDGYEGHYTHVFPLLKKYGYPAVFAVFTAKVEGDIVGRSTLTWPQLREMAASPLVEIVSHSVNHPRDLRDLSDQELAWELVESKRLLEQKLEMPIPYFSYPEGKYDERVAEAATVAGYQAALTMEEYNEAFAGESESLLAIARFGQSQLRSVLEPAWGGSPFPRWGNPFNFYTPVELRRTDRTDPPLLLISGGRPITIHADSRYQVPEIIADTEAIAAVDGAFFSLKYLDSNVMIGPVMSQLNGEFVPGNASENPLLNSRPLVLISPNAVDFVPFDADRHNTLEGIQAESPDVTDAFVAAAWLVKDSQPQPAESFGTLFDFDARRHRAFWGINQAGQPVIGVSTGLVDSVSLGELLSQEGFREAIMLDSGASTSLAYKGESLVGYTPRPVPHVVGLVPPQQSSEHCILASEQQPEAEF